MTQRIASFEAETGIELSLAHYVEYHRLELDEIYRRDCWTNLCVKAGVLGRFLEPDTVRLAKGLRRLQHVTGVRQIRTLIEILDQAPSGSDLSGESVQRFLLMLHFSLWGRDWLPATIAESLERLRKNPLLLAELRELLYLKGRLAELAAPISLPFFCEETRHAGSFLHELLFRYSPTPSLLRAVAFLTMTPTISISRTMFWNARTSEYVIFWPRVMLPMVCRLSSIWSESLCFAVWMTIFWNSSGWMKPSLFLSVMECLTDTFSR